MQSSPRDIGTRCGVKLTVTASFAASAQFLLDLRHVAVIADAVRREPLARFRKQNVLLQRAAGAGDPRLGIDDDVVDAAISFVLASGRSASSTAVG